MLVVCSLQDMGEPFDEQREIPGRPCVRHGGEPSAPHVRRVRVPHVQSAPQRLTGQKHAQLSLDWMAGKLLHPGFMGAPSARTSFVFAVLRHVTLVLVCWLAGLVTASGQVLLTGEPGGSGAQGAIVSGNVISPKAFANLANVWGQYGYGLTDRVDIFAAYGAIRVFDETQHYVGIGSNVGILQRRRHGLDVSLFSNVSLPLTHRDKAASVLVTIAVIASRPVTLGSLRMTTYGGFESLAPVGHRARGVFTPVETLHAGIIGVAIPLQKAWTAYVEYNPGPNLRSAGVGIAFTIPTRPPAVQ